MMIRAILNRIWPDPKAARLAEIERKAMARLKARQDARDACRRRHTEEAHRAHVRATAELLAAETGREWMA